MNRYYLNGTEISQSHAAACFRSVYLDDGSLDPAAVADAWNACQTSEEARDTYLTGTLEIVQG